MSETVRAFPTDLPVDVPDQVDNDLRYLKLNQTTSQTMAGLEDGLLNLTLGVIGTDTTTAGLAASALQSETDPVFGTWLSTTPPLYPGGWYDTDQSSVYISGFYNDSGFLTYYDTIGHAENANYAYYSDSSNYAYSADYAYYWGSAAYPSDPYDGVGRFLYNDSYGSLSWVEVEGDTTFTQWRDGTAFQPTGPCQFDDDATTPTKYARYWNTSNSSLAEWWDGTNTFTMGGASGLSYISGEDDILATLNGTYCHYIDAGTSDPFYYQNTKSSTGSVINFGIFSRKTTGTAADGIGGAIPFYLTNDNGDQEIFAQFEVIGTDVSDGSEDGDFVIKTVVAGSLTEGLRVKNGSVAYTPTTGSDWADPDPTTIQEALDRIAAVLTANSMQP